MKSGREQEERRRGEETRRGEEKRGEEEDEKREEKEEDEDEEEATDIKSEPVRFPSVSSSNCLLSRRLVDQYLGNATIVRVICVHPVQKPTHLSGAKTTMDVP